MSSRRLTSKQQRFVDAYCGEAMGNATEAARIAGYRGGARTWARVGSVNIRNCNINNEIENRTKKVRSKAIMTAEERQEWLTSVIQGRVLDGALHDGQPVEAPPKLKDRISAADQLSKMQGSFISKHEITGRDGSPFAMPTVIRIVDLEDDEGD